MATETPAPAVPAGSGDEPGAGPYRTLPAAAVVALALVLTAAVALASLAGQTATVVLAAVALGAAAYLLGRRSFLHLFVLASLVRPLVDLTAAPRDGGITVTELFGVGMLAVLGGWLVLHRRELAPRLASALPLSLCALVASYALATLGSQDPLEGLAATLRIAAGVAVFLVVDLLLVAGRLTVARVMALVVAVSAVPLVYPLLGVVGVPVTTEKDGVVALKSVFYLSNNFAHFLVPLLVVGVAYALRSRGTLRVAALGYSAVVAVELVLTQTRGAWIGAAVGVLIVCLLLDRRVAVAGAIGLVVAALTVPAISTRIADLSSDEANPYSESSFGWRLGQWDRLLPQVEANPVTGSGPGTAVLLTGKEAHNDYLKAAVETGAFGLGAYLAVLGAAVVVSWRAHLRVRRLRRAHPGSPAAGPLVEATFAAVAAYSVAIVISSVGENLIDNLTFLWATLPLFALAHWALRAPPEQLAVEVGGRRVAAP